MAGGAGNPGVMDLDDDALVELVLADLRGLMGLRGEPELVNIIRHRRAIAQYVPGHLARLQAIDAAAARHGTLWFSGQRLPRHRRQRLRQGNRDRSPTRSWAR